MNNPQAILPAPDPGVYREQFLRGVAARAGQEPAWLASLRQGALARFEAMGLPTLEQEDWRFTNLAPLARLPFRPVLAPPHPAMFPEGQAPEVFRELEGPRLVFVNGHYSPALSKLGTLPAGVRVTHLADALAREPQWLERHLTQYIREADNPFSALNTAFFQDGAFIHVPAGQTVPDPIQLVFLSGAKDAGMATHPRNLVIAEARSQLTVIESYLSTNALCASTNAVTELVAGDQAVVEHLKYQQESRCTFHLALLQAHLDRDCRFASHSLVLGARLARNNIQARLAGEGAECVFNGLYLTRGEQLADHHLVVDHAQPRCASHEYFNGILDGKSKGVFHGRIRVQPGAQKTDAKQTNKNLLLSDTATINSKPQLEIYADDVKCTHGATVGQLDPEAVYYLRSRGIGLPQARRMLIHAFAGEIIGRVQCAGVREILDQRVWDRLEQNPHVAQTPCPEEYV